MTDKEYRARKYELDVHKQEAHVRRGVSEASKKETATSVTFYGPIGTGTKTRVSVKLPATDQQISLAAKDLFEALK